MLKETVIGWSGAVAAGSTEEKKLNSLFGIPVPDAVLVQTRQQAEPVKTDPNYWFEPVMLNKLLRWIYGESSRRNVLLIGRGLQRLVRRGHQAHGAIGPARVVGLGRFQPPIEQRLPHRLGQRDTVALQHR